MSLIFQLAKRPRPSFSSPTFSTSFPPRDARNVPQRKPYRSAYYRPDATAQWVGRTIGRILRHRAVWDRIPIRPDGFMKLEDLMRHPRLRFVKLETLIRVVRENPKPAYTLKQDPRDGWMIRSYGRHTMKSVNAALRLLRVPSFKELLYHSHPDDLPMLQQHGIRPGRDGLIWLDQSLPQHVELKRNLEDASPILTVVLDVPTMQAKGIDLYSYHNSRVATQGDPTDSRIGLDCAKSITVTEWQSERLHGTRDVDDYTMDDLDVDGSEDIPRAQEATNISREATSHGSARHTRVSDADIVDQARPSPVVLTAAVSSPPTWEK